MTPHVYFLRPIGADGPVKIGSSIAPWNRLSIYMAWSPVRLELAATLVGGQHLERRFHAAFAAHHSHHEWFRAAPEITSAIEAIKAGTFDPATLPDARCLTGKKFMSRESIVAGILTRRVEDLRKQGVPIPHEVYDSKNVYRNTPEEVAAWRAIVREFLVQNDPRPLPEAA